MAQLTTKELSAIEDQLGAEQMLVSKYKCYSQLSTDPQLKAKYEQLAGKHQNHYERLLSCLD